MLQRVSEKMGTVNIAYCYKCNQPKCMQGNINANNKWFQKRPFVGTLGALTVLDIQIPVFVEHSV